jgi:hypothetical protein
MFEWIENENDIEGYAQWMAKNAQWEMLLKNHIKSIVQRMINMNDYRIIKNKKSKKMVNINTSHNSSTSIDSNRFRQVKLVEKYVTKYDKGMKPDNWLDMFNYLTTHEYFNYFLADDTTNKFDLQPVSQTNNRIIITENNMNSTKNVNQNILNVRNTNGANLTTMNTISAANNNGINIDTATTMIKPDNQTGGNYNDYDDYQDKYIKYKKKYLDLKMSN